MSAYVIFDVEIRDMSRYQEFMKGVKPALDAAGARYLARGGAHKVYEGDWQPRRIVVLEFPSVSAWESFYTGPVYQGLKAIRDECSSARLVPAALMRAVRDHKRRTSLPWAEITGNLRLMARPLAIIQQEIHSLTTEEKEEILRSLIEELDGPADPAIEAAWLDEAERRGKEIDSGTVKCVPAKDVFAKLDAILNK